MTHMAQAPLTSDAAPATDRSAEWLTAQIKSCAASLGFEACGIAPAVTPQGVTHLRAWLERGFAGEMAYMQRHAAARAHPSHVLDGVRSIVVAAANYRTVEPDSPGPLQGRVSRYAWGRDYHDVVRERLKQLLRLVEHECPDAHGRAVVDTAPLLERDFARLAGIGWIGKNTMLISKRLGSWLFLGALLLDVELVYDTPHHTDHCGTCTRCLDACPTQAFAAAHQLDSRRCISYLTIELRGPIPDDLRAGLGDWLFGCDVCQDVCPWNRKVATTADPAFHPQGPGVAWNLVELLEADDATLRQIIVGTAMERAGTRGLRRNAAILLGNAGDPTAVPALRQAAQSADPVVREAAVWALTRFEASGTDRSSAVER
jgi:epoxyqueuosine reductase